MDTDLPDMFRLTATPGQVLRAFYDADHCHGLVTHQGEDDACGKPPVALIDSTGVDFEAGVWPACAWHANRYGRQPNRVIPLAEVAKSLQVAEPCS